jgi:REP element-mobilizing transposase RayT
MANTYTQIHIQVIFGVKYRQALIRKEWKNELYKYMTGIVQHYGHKMICINGVEDHIHMLFGFRPTQSLSDLVKQVKQSSSAWINEQNLVSCHFSWQSGFGAFSYSKSHLDKVINYIKLQEEHHQKKSFREEYVDFLEAFKVDYDQRYIFKELE